MVVVNTTQVAPDEVLSYNVYYYEMAMDTIVLAWKRGNEIE